MIVNTVLRIRAVQLLPVRYRPPETAVSVRSDQVKVLSFFDFSGKLIILCDIPAENNINRPIFPVLVQKEDRGPVPGRLSHKCL